MNDDAAIIHYDPRAFEDLIQALEAARSRLAIAAAADSKMTPPSQRRLYLETDARLRRCLRRLRDRQWPGCPEYSGWAECVESLSRMLAEGVCRGSSWGMCLGLSDILARLEGGTGGIGGVADR